MRRKIKARLLIEVETSFDDNVSDEETVAYCIGEDLQDLGWQINNIEIYEEEEED